VYTCRCGEDLYPRHDTSRIDGLMDCPGCSVSYNASEILWSEVDEET
jgi:hypothetical protein